MKAKHVQGCNLKYTILPRHSVKAVRCLSKRNKKCDTDYIKCYTFYSAQCYCKCYFNENLYLIPDSTL